MIIVTADAGVFLVVAGGAFAQVYVELLPNDGGVGGRHDLKYDWHAGAFWNRLV